MRFRPAYRRLTAGLGTLSLVLALSASSAAASDTFFLENESKTATLFGTSLWGKGNTMAASCRTGPFPGPTLTGFTFSPGDTGSITLSQDPFSDCLSGINPLIYNTVEGPGTRDGSWVWIAVDPFVGDAHLTCAVLGQKGSDPVESSVDGLTCTISDSSDATQGSFGSSAAPLRNRRAVAYVQHFPGSKPGKSGDGKARPSGRRRARYAVALRTRGGRLLGRKRVTVVAGKPRRVRVPVSATVRRRVADKGFARAQAVIRRADGERGGGDRAAVTVVQDSDELPF